MIATDSGHIIPEGSEAGRAITISDVISDISYVICTCVSMQYAAHIHTRSTNLGIFTGVCRDEQYAYNLANRELLSM